MFTRTQQPIMVAKRFAQLHRLRYYEGRRCPDGHTLRYTTSNNCVECCKFHSMLQYYLNKLVTRE